MSEAKFTPGPYRDAGTCISAKKIGSRNRETPIATMNRHADVGGDEIVKANTALLVAAPDLYRTLEDLIGSARYEAQQGDGVSEEQAVFIEAARAALAKARGES